MPSVNRSRLLEGKAASFRRKHGRRPAARQIAAAAVLLLGGPAVTAVLGPVAGSAHAAVLPPGGAAGAGAGPGEPGNRLSYADSDFEGGAGAGDWTGISNASLSQSSTQAYLHGYSLQDTIGASGSSIFALGSTTIAVTGGATYRIGGYFKAPAASGRSVTWGLVFYDSQGFIGGLSTPAIPLDARGTWQYAAGTITAPANAAYVFGSPVVTYSGAAAGETVYLDEVAFGPYRAAQMIGAYAGSYSKWTAADSGQQIGPLQSDKVFFRAGLPVQRPGGPTPFQQTGCYQIWVLAGGQRPACIITYKAPMSQPQIDDFVRSIPPDQMVVLVYYQEPEGNSFSACGTSGGPAFVCEFDAQARMIRAAGDYPNVFVAMDAGSYEYEDPGSGHSTGYDCSFIPPASDVDMYLVDQYEGHRSGRAPPTGGALPVSGQPYQQRWTNWLKCVASAGKPVGLAEYGVNQGAGSSVISHALAADNAYLAGPLRASLNAPVLFWEYWWSGGEAFTDPGTESLWRSFETSNGGGVTGPLRLPAAGPRWRPAAAVRQQQLSRQSGHAAD